jgi:hypothetical protein
MLEMMKRRNKKMNNSINILVYFKVNIENFCEKLKKFFHM